MKTGTSKYNDTMTEEQHAFERYIDAKVSECIKDRLEKTKSCLPFEVDYLIGVGTVPIYAMPYIQRRFNANGFSLLARVVEKNRVKIYVKF